MQKVTLQIGRKRLLWLNNLKILCRGHMLLMVLVEKKLLETLKKKKLPKANQKKFRIKKVIKRKGDKLYVEWKG